MTRPRPTRMGGAVNDSLAPNRTARDDRIAATAADCRPAMGLLVLRLVGTEAAERRRAEIESDLWEQQSDARETGTRSSIVAGAIALRVVGGMPDDLIWVRTQRLAMRGQRADRKASAMDTKASHSPAGGGSSAPPCSPPSTSVPGSTTLSATTVRGPQVAAACFIYLRSSSPESRVASRCPACRVCSSQPARFPRSAAYWAPPLVFSASPSPSAPSSKAARRSAGGAAGTYWRGAWRCAAGSRRRSSRSSASTRTPVTTPLVAVTLSIVAVPRASCSSW